MKRKFFLHRINAPMDSDHVVYVVWVGESVREQRMLTQIVSWAFQYGATFRSWSEDIDFYLEIESERVFPGRGLLDFGFIRKDLSARDVLDLIESNSWEAFEHSLTIPKTQLYQMIQIDRGRVNEAEGRVLHRVILAEKSKNLSDNHRQQPTIIRFV